MTGKARGVARDSEARGVGRDSEAPEAIEAIRQAASPRVWLQVSRANSLAIATVGVLVGGAAAFWQGEASWRLLLAWVGAAAAQAGTNLTNVSYNYKAGAGPADRSSEFEPDPGASSAVVWSGRLSEGEVRRAARVCFGVTVAAGLVLTALCGWEILLFGLPGVAAGYFYAAPPLRLGRRALGVPTVFLFMGPVMVTGSAFTVTLDFSLPALAASIPVGLVAAGIMHVNDLRDFEDDRAHGKRTVATLLGRDRAVSALAWIDALAFALPVAGAAAGLLPWTVLLVLPTAPLAIGQVRAVHDGTPDRLAEAWRQGVKLHTGFGALLIAGLAAGALV